MKKIALTQGQFAIVDDEYFEELNKFSWCLYKDHNTCYAKRKLPAIDGKKITLAMHRYILGLTDSKIFVDHINGNGLDNRRENLRVCTNSENLRNRSKQKNNSSGFKGVSWHKASQKYSAQIKGININGKKHLGLYVCPIQAAKAYNEAAIKYHGEFAQLNEL
jgi:hypothetical protein